MKLIGEQTFGNACFKRFAHWVENPGARRRWTAISLMCRSPSSFGQIYPVMTVEVSELAKSNSKQLALTKDVGE